MNFADLSVLHSSNIWKNKHKTVNRYFSFNSTIEQYSLSLYQLIHIFIDIFVLRLSIKNYWHIGLLSWNFLFFFPSKRFSLNITLKAESISNNESLSLVRSLINGKRLFVNDWTLGFFSCVIGDSVSTKQVQNESKRKVERRKKQCRIFVREKASTTIQFRSIKTSELDRYGPIKRQTCCIHTRRESLSSWSIIF